MFAASLFLGWAISTNQLPGLDVLARFESFDFAWILARPLLFDLVLAGSSWGSASSLSGSPAMWRTSASASPRRSA